MALDLFAGLPVRDFAAAQAWYERLLGASPAFFPHDTEAVWGLDEHQWLYIVQMPERAGNALVTVIVDDFDARVAALADRGLEPTTRDVYENNVCKWIYHDPDGNEIGFGSVPAS